MGDVFQVFAKLGILGFGGPIAVMALMHEEAVQRRKWLSADEFSKLLSICKLLPGPQATQLAILLGVKRTGAWTGGVLAGVLFVFPAFLCMVGLGWLTAGDSLGGLQPFLTAMQGGALALILQSVWMLGRGHWRSLEKSSGSHSGELMSPKVLAIACFFLSFALTATMPRYEPVFILACGFAGVIFLRQKEHPQRLRELGTILALLWICFKAGAFMFGSGLAIVPLLEQEVVRTRGWITHREFMEGLAFGQITPGPVVITVTYIGYKVAGFFGAVVATVAAFAPSFFNALVLVPRFLAKASERRSFSAFSETAVASVVGALWATLILLCLRQLKDAEGVLLSSLAFVLTGAAMFATKRIPAVLLLPAVAGFTTLVLRFFSN